MAHVAARRQRRRLSDGYNAASLKAPILRTPRLSLRELTLDDAGFIVELLNDPSWLRFIGDKNVRTLEDARRYLANGRMKMYAEQGFGLWLVERGEDGAQLGICGLVKRE